MDEELVQLALRECVTAQDTNRPFYLSKLSSYEIYHKNSQNNLKI